jgi:hypothetical protein
MKRMGTRGRGRESLDNLAHGAAWRGTAWLGRARPGSARLGGAWQGKGGWLWGHSARLGLAGRGMARLGSARHGLARQGWVVVGFLFKSRVHGRLGESRFIRG